MKKNLLNAISILCLTISIVVTVDAQQKENKIPRINENGQTLLHDESSSPLEQYRDKKEDLSRRDLYSKHFMNDDGSYTAVIGAGPIHYEKNGVFHDIDHTITTNGSLEFPYANKTNLMESYFGASSHLGIKSVTVEGEVKEFLNTKMYWEVNGQAINTVMGADAQVSIADNKATYLNLFGNINAEFSVETARRKLNYVIPNAQALVNIPAGAQYLVFSEDVIIPNGWSYEVDERYGVVLTDDTGRKIYSFDRPVSTDASYGLESDNTTMEVMQDGNVLRVLTKVETSWLMDNERQFPVMVDPTGSYVGNVSSSPFYSSFIQRNGSTYTYGSTNSINFGRAASTTNLLRGYVQFNLTALYTILGTSVTGNISDMRLRVQANFLGSAGIFAGRLTSQTPNVATAVNLYNAIAYTTTASTGYYGVFNNTGLPAINTYYGGTLVGNASANPISDLQSNFTANNQYFNIGFRANGDGTAFANNTYWTLYGTNTASRNPILEIDYTVPNVAPPCATLVSPVDGITNAASGQQLTWNAASGATSYDVHFGTSGTPALVGNVAVTNYNPGCLEPNTTYYWKIVPKNANGSATGCATWSFITTGQLAIYAQNWDGISTPGMFSEITAQDGWLASSTADQGGGSRNVWAAHTYAGRSITGNSIGMSAYQLNAPVATGELAYYDDVATDRWLYRNVPTTGLKDVTVSFRYRAGGEAGADYGSVMYNPTGANPQSSNNWLEDPSQGGNNDDNRFYNQANPTYESILLPTDADNNANLRIGFRWTSNANVISSYPSFVVDDIIVSGCPTGGNITPLTSTFNSSNSATLTLSSVLTCAKFQWEQSSSATGPWTDILGATANVLNTGTVSSSTYYRCKVYYGTCDPSYQTQVASVQIISPAVVKLYNYGGTTQLTFNNSRSNTTNQVFRLSHSLITAEAYQIEVNTAADFSGTAYIQNFTGSYVANTQANYTFSQLAGSLVDGTTYYVRVRVLESGSLYSVWTTGTYSFTYNAAIAASDWFQTTQSQFQTAILSGTEANPADNVVVSSNAGGSFINPSFESTDGWSLSQSYSVYETYRTNNANGTNGTTNGSYCLKFAEDNNSWQSFVNGEYNNASQQVNLTGVSNIQFDITHWRNTQSNVYQCGIGRACKVVWSFQVIVGDAGTQNNNSGTVVYTWTPTTAEFGVTNNPNVTVNLSGLGFTGVKTVKFARVVTNGGGVWYDDDKYYLDNIRTNVSNSGTTTSPTIYLASRQNVSDWDVLTWNQTLNGGTATLKVQKVVSGTWTDVAGLNNITAGGDGLKTQSLASIGLGVDSIRIVASMAGTTSPILHDWSVKAGACVAAQISSHPADASLCSGGSTSFIVVASGDAPLDYQWQFSINNGQDWDNIIDGGVYSGATTTTLNITGVTFGMSGYLYRAIVTNECGEDTSDTAELEVPGCAPIIDAQPQSSTIGCTVGVTSLTVATTSANSYQWQLSTNGGGGWSNLANAGKYSGVNTITLNISNPTAAMSGYQYQVVVSNGSGSVTSTVSTLTVQVCPTNDNPAPNNPPLSSVNYVYPNCYSVSGTTVGATVNPLTGTRDVWYQFVAISNGVSIKVSSTQIDPVIYLYNGAATNLLDEESIVTGTGAEILNYGTLVAGQNYRIAVASENATDGAFSICVQQLREPNCGTPAPYGLCTAFKSTLTGAATTTYNFTQGATTTTTTSVNPITLGQASLQLSYGGSYDVGLVANYVLQDGSGQNEAIQVANPNACSITISAHPAIEVRSNLRCANGAVLYRSSYLQAQPVGTTICGVTGYRVEFTQVDNCLGANPQTLDAFSKTITSPTASISLTYAFNHLVPLVDYPHIGYWSVRWLPRFGSIEGTYGDAHIIAVNATSATPPAGMSTEEGDEANALVNTTGIEANLYPNPNNGDMINLNMTGITTDNVHVRIMDGMGRVVYTNRYTVDGSLNTIVTFSKPLANGLYMVEFTACNEVITQRMMVAK